MNEKDILEKSKRYAEKKGYLLNPDERVVDFIIKGLKKNEEKQGFQYCPCRRISGDKEKDAKNICPCVFHEDEIRKDGRCHCMLFVRKK